VTRVKLSTAQHSPLVLGHHDVTPLLLVKVGGNALERVGEHGVEFGVLGEETVAIDVRDNVEDQLLALEGGVVVSGAEDNTQQRDQTCLVVQHGIGLERVECRGVREWQVARHRARAVLFLAHQPLRATRVGLFNHEQRLRRLIGAQ
jgi:hypothetical protein